MILRLLLLLFNNYSIQILRHYVWCLKCGKAANWDIFGDANTKTLLPCCFGGDGLPQKSLLIVLIRRPFSVFFFSSNLEKVRGVPSLLGLQGTTTLNIRTKPKDLKLPVTLTKHPHKCVLQCLFRSTTMVKRFLSFCLCSPCVLSLGSSCTCSLSLSPALGAEALPCRVSIIPAGVLAEQLLLRDSDPSLLVCPHGCGLSNTTPTYWT